MAAAIAETPANIDTAKSIFNGADGRISKARSNHFGGDVGCLRPWKCEDTGKVYITLNQFDLDPKNHENIEVTNSPLYAMNSNPFFEGTLAFRDWFYLDQKIIRAARPELRALADLKSNGLEQVIPGGLGKTVYQYQRVSNISPATMSMDGLRESEHDRPVFDLNNMPLPIIHKDFEYGARELMASNNGSNPLSSTTGELAGRKVIEYGEQLVLGLLPTFTYGGGSIYGYTNFPFRLTYVCGNPTTPGWTPQQLLDDVLQMILLSREHYYYGPWVLYHSLDFSPYMDDDFSQAKGDWTLRERIEQIRNIQEVRESAWLWDFQLVLVQQTSNVVELLNGMDMVTTQWMLHGGMETKFKTMMINVPLLRTDINGNTGIVHAAAANPGD